MADEKIITEKDYKRNIRQKITHTLCLILPIGGAFLGYFLADPFWKLFSKDSSIPELWKFLCSILLFSIICILVYVKTRNTNPIIKIRVFRKNK